MSCCFRGRWQIVENRRIEETGCDRLLNSTGSRISRDDTASFLTRTFHHDEHHILVSDSILRRHALVPENMTTRSTCHSFTRAAWLRRLATTRLPSPTNNARQTREAEPNSPTLAADE